MFILELYIWAMVVTAVACASLAGAIWPVTVAVRLYRAVRRQRQRGLLLKAIADAEVRRG